MTNARFIGNHRTLLLGIIMLIAALALAGPAPAAHAAGITVTSLADDGSGGCTLREAIDAANSDTAVGGCTAGAGADTITFGLSGTITLSEMLPIVSSSVTIDGTGRTIAISGNNSVRLLYVRGGELTLNALTLRDARFTVGAAVYNESVLHVRRSTFVSNNAPTIDGGFGHGAAIFNASMLTVSNSTFSQNSAGNLGGAIYNRGTAQVSGSTLAGNGASSGGGIYNTGVATFTNSIIANSTSGGDCAGTITAGAVNLDTDGTCGDATQTTAAALNLQPPAANGGPTQTIALGPGSIALDRAPSASCGAGTATDGVDQRGQPRNVNGSGGSSADECDAGAYEEQTPPPDTTPPVITATVSGTLGNNGWYRSNVTVSWSVVDHESAVTATGGCGNTILAGDTAGMTFTCSATSAGGSSSKSVTVKRDATPPSISGSFAPDPNGSGWNNTDVGVTFTCSDNLSGVATCGPNTTLTATGAGQTAPGTVVDQAGNSNSTTVGPINIDKTKPAIGGSASPAANANGWHNGDVTVTFTCSDTPSGIATCTPPQTLSAEGAGQNVNGTAVDKAGNSKSTTVTVSIDKTAPTAAASVSPDANANGWHNSPVTVSFSGTDGLSSIASCDPAVVLGSEGANQSAGGTCTDKAGNVSAPATATGIDIDLTPPAVSVTGVGDGAIYTIGTVPTAGCATTDPLSGVATAATPAVSGGSANGVGAFTATCAGAADNAGNQTGPVSATYTVAYSFSGFFPPIANPPALNSAQAGETVPVKFSLDGDYGLGILAGGYPRSELISCADHGVINGDAPTATAGQSQLSYDAETGEYVYRWKTDKSWGGTCRQLVVRLDDTTVHTALFEFK